MARSNPVSNEFSRCFSLDRLAAGDRNERIVANQAERAALAKRFGLEGIDHLAAELTLRREAAGGIRVWGHLSARVTQLCVISLEPFDAEIDERFDLRFVEPPLSAAGTVEIDPLGEDPPEPLTSGQLDLGEAVAQQLAVCLDPYPRKPGAVLAGEVVEPEAKEQDKARRPKPNPFAALAELKDRLD
jgi:uncharacterized metal-binding protein YceD (DUF177 family)